MVVTEKIRLVLVSSSKQIRSLQFATMTIYQPALQNYIQNAMLSTRYHVDYTNARRSLYLPIVHLWPVNPSGQMQRNPPRNGKQTDRL